MDFNCDSAGIRLTDMPPLAIADFFPSSADVSEKLNSASSVFRLFLAISEKNVLVEVPPGASVGAPATSSNWASARRLASAASAAAWCDESTGTDALLGLVTLSVAVILRFGRALYSGHFMEGVINEPSCRQTFSMDDIASETVAD